MSPLRARPEGGPEPFARACLFAPLQAMAANGSPGTAAYTGYAMFANMSNTTLGNSSPFALRERVVASGASLGTAGGVYGYLLNFPSPGPYPTIGFNNYWNGTGYAAGLTGTGGVFQYQNGDGKLIYYTAPSVPAGSDAQS